MVLAMSLALPSGVLAQPTAEPENSSEEAKPPKGVDEAKSLYKKGRARYLTFDYDGAIQYWTDALAALPEEDATRAIRNDIVYNIAAAHMEAYKQSRQRVRLVQAKDLLRFYLDEFANIYGSEVETADEAVRVQKRLDEIESMLEEHDREAKAGAKKPAPEAAPTDRGEPDRPYKGLIIGGSIVLAGGAGLLAGMGVGLGRGKSLQQEGDDADPSDKTASDLQDLERRGTNANRLAIATGVAGGVLLGVGVALLAIGVKRQRKQTALVPAVGPGLVGLRWEGRF